MMPVEAIGLVMEKIRKMVLCAIAEEDAGLCLPSASNQPIWPRRATITVMPGRVPFSISRLNAFDMCCNQTGERPNDSGLAWGSDGVCGAGACFAAVCAFMVSPVLLLSFAGSGNVGVGQVWRRTLQLNSAFSATS